MVYVVAVLIIIAIVAGAIHSKKAKSADTGCSSGCSSCPYHSECGKNEKK